MSIQSDLKTVTDEIFPARVALMQAESERATARYELNQAETRLAVARAAIMARSNAGANDTSRRAYADRETADDRDEIERLQYRVVQTEIAVIEAAAALRSAEDRRRYLENVVQLTINVAADMLQAAYNGDEPGF